MKATNQQWEESGREFYQAMLKLDLDDLKTLCWLFECYPSYAGTVTSELCVEYLWTKLMEWRRGNDRLGEMSAALRVLGVGR